jgi:lytic murein transglycosylase
LLLALVLAGCASHAPSGALDQAQNTGASSSTAAQAQADNRQKAHAEGRNAVGFARWVARFRRRARDQGVAGSTLKAAFDDVRFLPRVIVLDHRQPEFTRPIWDYLDAAVSATRVAHGRKKRVAHRDTVDRVATRYGVPGAVLLAIWGMESNYGRNCGNYETIDALATLGYDGRRETFAEKQLHAALKILADGDISRSRMRGSWAGAMGNTQFLPTSFLAYAVDADGDGRRDIWGSVADTMASTANYLAQNGWRAGEPWGREVVLPADFDYAQADGRTRRPSAAWRAHGVRAVDARGLPPLSSAAIIAPAGASGPAFMVGPNFRTILRYNNATSYALAVGLLADQIAGGPGVQRAWPRAEASLSRQQVRRLQQSLNRLGYATGTPDGLVGSHTRSGIRAFQQARGLPADGFPTRSLLEKIEAAAGG